MKYRYLATSIEGFVKQLAVHYLVNGYTFYVSGFIPAGKDPLAVDQKILEKYGVVMSKWERSRRKKNGEAAIQYLRFDQRFILIATHGKHLFYEEEKDNLRDIRVTPFKFWGYSISYKAGHPHVRIANEEYKRLKEYFVSIALMRETDWLATKLSRSPFEPYAPVRRQLFHVLRAVNRERKLAAKPLVHWKDAIRMRNKVVSPFKEYPS